MYKFLIVLFITLITNIDLCCNTTYAGSANYMGPAVVGTVIGTTFANHSDNISFNMDLKYCIAHIYNKDGSLLVEGVVQKSKGKNGFTIITINDREYIATLSNAQFDITKANTKYREGKDRFGFAFTCAMLTCIVLLTFSGMALSKLDILCIFSLIGIISFLVFCLFYSSSYLK